MHELHLNKDGKQQTIAKTSIKRTKTCVEQPIEEWPIFSENFDRFIKVTSHCGIDEEDTTVTRAYVGSDNKDNTRRIPDQDQVNFNIAELFQVKNDEPVQDASQSVSPTQEGQLFCRNKLATTDNQSFRT